MGNIDYFDSIAPIWDGMQNEFFDNSVRDKALELVDIKEESIAVDLGAGTGYITEKLLNKDIYVIAIDQSEEMLIQLRNKWINKKNIICLLGDAYDLPVENDSVDYVFANMFLHHVQNPLKAIREIHRILKEGGKVVITDLDSHNFSFLKEDQHDIWMGFERKQIKSWMNESGFINEEVHCVGSNCCTKSECGCKEASISIFASVAVKSKKQRYCRANGTKSRYALS